MSISPKESIGFFKIVGFSYWSKNTKKAGNTKRNAVVHVTFSKTY
jgi:hypothetical protein